MEGLDLRQLSAMTKVIAEEKGLPEDTILEVVQMAIAAAWRKDHGDKEMNVRALLDTNTVTSSALPILILLSVAQYVTPPTVILFLVPS